jgi:Spy/CpxP family protein refolding chaperone
MITPKKGRTGTLLAAVVLIAALWPGTARAQAQQTPQDKPQAQEKSRMRDMARDLFNISPEQEKQIQALREARLKDGQTFREQMTKMRGEMRDLMKDPKANAAKIDGLIDGLSKLRADRQKAAFRTRGEWEKIFTPEQLEKMKTYRESFRGRFGMSGRGRLGLGRPWMGRFTGPRARGWRMRAAAWRWRHPFFWRGW